MEFDKTRQSGDAFGSFALVRFLFVCTVNSSGEITKATLPTWRAAALVRHDRFCLRPTSQLPRRIIHGDAAKIAHRADFSSAPVCVPISGYGRSERAETPLNWFANVAFCPPAWVSLPGGEAMPMLPKCPLRAVSTPMFVLPTRWARLQRSKIGADSLEKASPPNFVAALGLRPV